MSGAVDLDRVGRTRVFAHLRDHVTGNGPVVVAEIAAVHLGDVGEGVVFGVFEDLVVHCRMPPQVTIVEHVGGENQNTFLPGLLLNFLNPVFAPGVRFTGLVVHAVEHIGIFQ